MLKALRFGYSASILLSGVFMIYAMFCAANLHFQGATFAMIAGVYLLRLSGWCLRQQTKHSARPE